MRREVSLDDKYTLEEGLIYATGVQALVRLPIDQHRMDHRRGLRTAGFISGYPGSPLGTYDLALQGAREILRRHDIVHVPGVNEELAATSVFGSQLTHLFPGQKFDGVVGYWYGKGPGVDRSGDAFKHASFVGTQQRGGALVFAGDDPVAKSSTLPFGSESTLSTFGFPILYPGNTQEVLDLGLHGVALSRFARTWVALKLVNNVCDGGGTAIVSPERIDPILPEYEPPAVAVPPQMRHMLVPAVTVPLEGHVHHHRLEAAALYAHANRLNAITINPSRARLGIAAAGKTYRDLVQSLRDMEVTDAELEQAGIRLLRLGMVYPLDPRIVEEFADGLEEILVVEEKRAFIEGQLKALLYNQPRHPRIVGKFDHNREPLVPIAGGLTADRMASFLAPRLLELGSFPGASTRLTELDEAQRAARAPALVRANNFCSGCPHNRSTLLLEGQLAGGGIGCHTMAVMTGQRERSFEYVTQMGGEGAVWVGASPFVEHPHLFQNLGDGTYFHSGRLGVEAAIAAGTKMTFKILYNSHVAMTGGQDPAGSLSIAALTRELHAMGASQIFLVTEEPDSHRARRQELAPEVAIYDREELPRVLRLCEETPGVSILIYDQPCAAERRRKRRRGLVPTPNRWVMINEEVCEGCGDCGEKSNCMSLVPVETEFGPKTAVHLSSCNQDEFCLQGDCPAFVVVETNPAGGLKKGQPRERQAESPPEPAEKGVPGDGYTILMTGVGGTGVVTVNAVLAFAALMEGKHCASLDQIGLAQKGGAVVSSLVIADRPMEGNSAASCGRADLLLGLDILGAVNPENLSLASPQRTAAVINTTGIPTAEMIRDKNVGFPSLEEIREAISDRTERGRTIFAAAGELVENLFNDHMMTNVFCLGIAYQAGFLPLEAQSLEQAIRLNGVAVERNLAAFRWGRRLVSDPEALAPYQPSGKARDDRAHRRAMDDLAAAGERSEQTFRQILEGFRGSPELRRMVEIRVANLVLYQNADLAREYRAFLDETGRLEEEKTPGREEVTRAVARYLYKLMANKDEYEVARLHLRAEARNRIEERFDGVRKVSVMLHPPTLRRWGLQRKIALGPTLRWLLWLLARMKWIRGTRFDLFGRTSMRRLERSLPDWYRGLMREGLAKLRPESHDLVLKLAELPDSIRGYEDIRKRSIDRSRAKAQEYLAELDSPQHRVAV